MNVKIVSESSLVRDIVIKIIDEKFSVDEVEGLDSLNQVDRNELLKVNFICMLVDKDQINELEIVSNIKKINKDIKILVMDLWTGGNLLSDILNYDIDGYISSKFKKDDLVSVIRLLINGKKYYDGKSIIETIGKHNYYKSYKLTDREKEILEHMINGLDNKDIANNLYISENTVKKHITSILTKLNFKNRKQAIIQMKQYNIV